MSSKTRLRSKSEVVRSLYPFHGNDGMIFEPGETIAVTEKAQNGWWRGTLRKNGTNMEGWFPSGYVEIDLEQPNPNEGPSSPITNGVHDLPDGWKQAISSDGKTYYYNHITQETTWQIPQHINGHENGQIYNNNDISLNNSMDAITPPRTRPKPVRSATLSANQILSSSEESTPVTHKTEMKRTGSRSSIGKISIGDGSNSSPSPHSSQGSLDSFGSTSRRRKTKPINLTPVRPNYLNYPDPGKGSDQGLLNNLEVSYCDYFWEDREDSTGFDVVLDHVHKGRSFCKEMAEFFRERALIEDLYSRNLVRLSKSHYADMEQGTLGRAWQRLKKGLEEEALYHQRLSQMLMEKLEKSFSDYSEIPAAEKKEIKKLESTVQDGRKKVVTSFKDLEKQKSTYSEKQKLLENLQSNQSPNKVSDKDIAKAKKKMLSAADDMKSTCETYNENQRKWVEESTLALIELEKSEKERVEYVKDHLLKYVGFLNTTIESNTKVFTDVRDKVDFVNAVQDREEFVQKYATGKIRPVDLKL